MVKARAAWRADSVGSDCPPSGLPAAPGHTVRTHRLCTGTSSSGWLLGYSCMQHVVFGAVMGDAAMLEAALERDVYGLSAHGGRCCCAWACAGRWWRGSPGCLSAPACAGGLILGCPLARAPVVMALVPRVPDPVLPVSRV